MSQEKISRNNSGDNSLYKIYNWLQERLDTGEASKGKDTAKLQKEFIQDKINKIAAVFGKEEDGCELVTVRSAFCKSQEYLRPVYSVPGSLKKYLGVPELQNPFSYEFVSNEYNGRKFPLPFTGLHAMSPDHLTTPPPIFGALHIVKPFTKESGNPDDAFAPRIDKFWEGWNSSIEHVENKKEESSSEKILYCYFAGRNKKQNGVTAQRVELEHIVAIYFTSEKGLSTNRRTLIKQIKTATNIATDLFIGIDLVSRIDSSLFKLEGLQLVAKLLPEFSDDTKAPADKIALAIKQIKGLLGCHLVGRQDEQSFPDVFYLTASFEQLKEGEPFFPRLEVYPHASRVAHRDASYQIAHKKIPSATKFLLNQYLRCKKYKIVFGKENDPQAEGGEEWAPVSIHQDFENLFTAESLGTPSIENWLKPHIWSQDKPDLLHMVSHDNTWKDSTDKISPNKISPWDALYRAANPNQENNSIVAVVVEGEEIRERKDDIIRKTLPRGVLAIESSYVDAFSDEDIIGLMEVFEGLASLIRQITHKNSSLDYRSKLAGAFHRFVPADHDLQDGLAERLMFAVQKLDVAEFNSFFDYIDRSPQNHENITTALNNYKLTEEAFEKLRQIKESFIEYSVGVESDEHEGDKRVKWVREWLRNGNSQGTPDETIEFLEACTEDFKWAAFLSSFAQSLGDRVNDQVPKFRFMTPGYSANRMFMATVQHELRQVVKLSDATKLKKERKNYSQYIRYKVVNAAHIPRNGFAFETRGDGVGTEAYGALVSDLVSGQAEEQDVLTLLSAVVNVLLSNKDEVPEPSIMDMQTALKTFFATALNLWESRDNLKQNPLRQNVIRATREAFRLPMTWDINASSGHTNDPLGTRQEDLCTTFATFKEILSTNLLEDKWALDVTQNPIIDSDEFKNLEAIVHGDLNARNLTWAGGLKSFFMIDFEHVGPGFRGVDQCRLIVNLIAELFGEAVAEGPPDETQLIRLLGEVDQGVEFISEVGRYLLKGKRLSFMDISKKSLEKNAESDLCKILDGLIRSLENQHKTQTVNQYPKWNRFWGYVLFCSALKEFEYSCRSTNYEGRHAILSQLDPNKNRILGLNAQELKYLVQTSLNLDPERDSFKLSNYFRHFTIAKILHGICSS